LQDNVVALAGQNTRLDAEAQEAKAGQRRTEAEKVQLRLQYENLERNNKWLEENMGHLNDALKTERQKTAQQVAFSAGLLRSDKEVFLPSLLGAPVENGCRVVLWKR